MRALRMYVINIEYMCTLDEVISSKPPDGFQRQDPISKKSKIIYRYKCDNVECDEEYIRESSRTFGERFKEHLKAPFQYMTVITVQVMLPQQKISA